MVGVYSRLVSTTSTTAQEGSQGPRKRTQSGEEDVEETEDFEKEEMTPEQVEATKLLQEERKKIEAAAARKLYEEQRARRDPFYLPASADDGLKGPADLKWLAWESKMTSVRTIFRFRKYQEKDDHPDDWKRRNRKWMAMKLIAWHPIGMVLIAGFLGVFAYAGSWIVWLFSHIHGAISEFLFMKQFDSLGIDPAPAIHLFLHSELAHEILKVKRV